MLLIKLILLRELTKMPLSLYFTDVIIRIVKTLAVSLPLPLVMFSVMPRSIMSSLLIMTTAVLSVCVSSFYVGVSKTERSKIITIVKGKVFKNK